MSTTNSATAAWLTQEAFDRLKAELDHLSGPGRAEIVQKIEAARQEGDLKENGGYHAAKEEQGKIEARIRQLTALLRDAHVGESPADDGIVEPGMIVVAKIAGDEESFLLGSREIAGDSDLDVFSEKSPWARPSSATRRATSSATPLRTARSSQWRSSPPSRTPANTGLRRSQPQRSHQKVPATAGTFCVPGAGYGLLGRVPARGALRSRAASTPPMAPPRCACHDTKPTTVGRTPNKIPP